MEIESFPNPNPERNYTIQHIQEEFTSTCPMTGHPDYATVVFSYVPDEVCIELKAMKLYLHSFRNKGIFFEVSFSYELIIRVKLWCKVPLCMGRCLVGFCNPSATLMLAKVSCARL